MRPRALFFSLLLFAASDTAWAAGAPLEADLSPREQAIVAAARNVEHTPVFHTPASVGLWPGTPLVFKASVTGDRPMKFAARDLPQGLSLDAATGQITGRLAAAGEYRVTLNATNAAGQAETEVRIIADEKLALTPPLAWNSYDPYGDSVTEEEFLANAAWTRDHLQPFGWDTVMMEFRWYDTLADGRKGQPTEGNVFDEQGFFRPAPNRFPSSANGAGFKPLADKVHAMGLKFGLHLMRGIPRKMVDANLPIPGSTFRAADAVRPVGDPNRESSWNQDCYGVLGDTPAGKAWYAAELKKCAEWGVDYIKCDDLGYLKHPPNYAAEELEALAAAMRASGRSMLLSTSPGPTPLSSASHISRYANAWRISGDFWDDWKALDHHFGLFADWSSSVAPGTWPDGDMLPLGHMLIRNNDRPNMNRWTKFTRPEQLTLVSLWSVVSSPLLYAGAAVDTDAWTAALLTNPEVLAVNQDALGRPARRTAGSPQAPAEVWTKPLVDGGEAVGFFNRSDKPATVKIPWRNLGYARPPKRVRDLWTRQDLPPGDFYETELPPHGCSLLKVQGQ